jgi:hypothetical protein
VGAAAVPEVCRSLAMAGTTSPGHTLSACL